MKAETKKLRFMKPRQSLGRTPVITTRLASTDRLKFEQICQSEGKTTSQVARDALLFYIDGKERKVMANREDRLASVMKHEVNRLAGLLVRVSMDLGLIIYLMYRHMGEKERDDMMRKARDWSVKRLHVRLGAEEAELKEQLLKQFGKPEPSDNVGGKAR